MDEFLIAALSLLYGLATAILLSNLIMLRRRGRAPAVTRPSVSVLIPARNEEENLRRLLPSLLNQNYPELQIIVYDDGSEDGTWDEIQRHRDDRLRSIRGDHLPDGWLGKNHALHRVAKEASGEIFVFLDADTEFKHADALRSLVDRFLQQPGRSASAVSPDWSPGVGRLLVSLAPNTMLVSIPWMLTPKLAFPSMAALNGQCWMIRGDDYRREEPHSALRDRILEDVEIGRLLVRRGYTIWLTPARDELAIYMYSSFAEAWSGFRKNAYLLVGGTPVRFLIAQTLFLFLFVAAPVLAPFLLVWLVLLKAATDRAAGFNPLLGLLAPVSFLLGWILSWDSFLHHLIGRVSWKGRQV